MPAPFHLPFALLQVISRQINLKLERTEIMCVLCVISINTSILIRHAIRFQWQSLAITQKKMQFLVLTVLTCQIVLKKHTTFYW